MMQQQEALLHRLRGPEPVRVTLNGRVYGSDAPFGQKLLAFAPGRVTAPALPIVAPDANMQVSGRVRMPHGLARGVMLDGRVVAWAVAREPDETCVRHITIETDPRYRSLGCARACLQALCQATSDPLLYLCDSRNLHSAMTALSAGFVRIGTLEMD